MAFAVSHIEYAAALASAPLTQFMNSQFLFPTQNGRMALSANYENICIIRRTLYQTLCNDKTQLAPQLLHSKGLKPPRSFSH